VLLTLPLLLLLPPLLLPMQLWGLCVLGLTVSRNALICIGIKVTGASCPTGPTILLLKKL
jgi:hypothetical protein